VKGLTQLKHVLSICKDLAYYSCNRTSAKIRWCVKMALWTWMVGWFRFNDTFNTMALWTNHQT